MSEGNKPDFRVCWSIPTGGDKDRLQDAGALWVNKDKDGNDFLSGTFLDKRIVCFPVKKDEVKDERTVRQGY